jgi:thymidylate kinase
MMLLLEGTCGVGKTTLLRAMEELTSERGSPALTVLGQRFTYGPIAGAEDAGILDAELNEQILQRLLRRIITVHEQQIQGTLLVLDTFHVTQRVRPGVLSDAAFRACDQVLQQLRCRTVLLEVPDSVLLERVTVRRRDTGFARYASKFGSSESEVGGHFLREQALIRNLVTASSQLRWLRLLGTQSPRVLAAAAIAFAANAI